MFGKKKKEEVGMKGKVIHFNPPTAVSVERLERRLRRLRKFVAESNAFTGKSPEKLAKYEKSIRKIELQLKYMKGDF